MKLRNATIALVASGSLVLAGCTSEEPIDEPTQGAEDPAAQTDDAGGDSGDATSEDGDAASADTAKAELGDIGTKDDEIFFSSGEVEWSGFNGNMPETNSTYNATINNQLTSGFWYYGTDGTVYPDTSFGSYEVVNEDPWTVEYTINDDVTWSDGNPIDYTDALLDWASQNPEKLTEDPENPLFNNVGVAFGKYVPEGPQGEVGGKTFTVTYPDPYPDWEITIGSFLPAHVVAEQIGITEDELAQAILDNDQTVLAQAAEFWNQGWLSSAAGELPDPAIVPSSGPYTLDGATWRSGESLTLVPNEEYWGTPPATANLTFRFAAPETHVQALANGDLNVIEPQATVDTVAQIENLGDQVQLQRSDELTWEHLDFNFAGGPFADENGGLAAREAFALCVPRQLIIDNLIAPINPEAEVMNAREVFPFQENYDEIVGAAYDGRYDQVDLEAAKAKLAESGLETPVPVRIGYSAPNQRRTNQVSLIASSCNDPELFAVEDIGDSTFLTPEGALFSGDYEVALFAWAGSGQKASGQQIYATGETQNMGGYSSQVVDEAWATLASSSDEAVWLEQVKVIEKQLWDDLYGIPLFAHPNVIAYDSSISNVQATATQDGVTWNAEQWVRME
jgi:peptide/nickel transport system substrate-binding protein